MSPEEVTNFTAKRLHNTAQGRAAHPGLAGKQIAQTPKGFYKNHVAVFYGRSFIKPFQGLNCVGCITTQGALRHPGLCYLTPSA